MVSKGTAVLVSAVQLPAACTRKPLVCTTSVVAALTTEACAAIYRSTHAAYRMPVLLTVSQWRPLNCTFSPNGCSCRSVVMLHRRQCKVIHCKRSCTSTPCRLSTWLRPSGSWINN